MAAAMNSVIAGMQLAIAVGLTYAVADGLWARFSRSGNTLSGTINNAVRGGGN
tara:strand:+ start:1171 stop:1329 length:159 start_codon:yes stop_codon:yes gene_type:complete